MRSSHLPNDVRMVGVADINFHCNTVTLQTIIVFTTTTSYFSVTNLQLCYLANNYRAWLINLGFHTNDEPRLY